MFGLIGCTYQKADKAFPLINTMAVDENFCISLPENHTSGYSWQINPHMNHSLLDYYGSVFRGNEKGVDFNFRTLKRGKDTLNFSLIRYRDTSEIKQYIIEIK
jgi:predicted secreted protein